MLGGLYMAIQKIQTELRIDETTYGKLKTISENENRSLNNLIEYVLKSYLSDYEKKNGAILVDSFPEN